MDASTEELDYYKAKKDVWVYCKKSVTYSVPAGSTNFTNLIFAKQERAQVQSNFGTHVVLKIGERQYGSYKYSTVKVPMDKLHSWKILPSECHTPCLEPKPANIRLHVDGLVGSKLEALQQITLTDQNDVENILSVDVQPGTLLTVSRRSDADNLYLQIDRAGKVLNAKVGMINAYLFRRYEAGKSKSDGKRAAEPDVSEDLLRMSPDKRAKFVSDLSASDTFKYLHAFTQANFDKSQQLLLENGRKLAGDIVEKEHTSLCCPISCELMIDPVQAADGHTYERNEIEKWWKNGDKTSPRTGARMTNLLLVPNHCVKMAIDECCQKQLKKMQTDLTSL